MRPMTCLKETSMAHAKISIKEDPTQSTINNEIKRQFKESMQIHQSNCNIKQITNMNTKQSEMQNGRLKT